MTDRLPSLSKEDLDEILRLTASSVWDGLRRQSILLTGGTGFVGKWLLESLLHADREFGLGLTLTVLTRDPDRFASVSGHLASAPALRMLKGDVLDFNFSGGACSAVIHAALPVAPAQAGRDSLQHLAEAGARRVCEMAAAAGAVRFLHVSSGAVYGNQPASLAGLPEHWPRGDAEPANDYVRAKRLAEDVVLEGWPFKVVVARCFAFIGPYLQGRSGSAAAQFVERAADGGGLVIEGTGEAVRSYQYAGDMARWLLTCLVHGKAGRAYNVGDGAALTIAQLARRITEVAGLSVPARVMGRSAAGLAGQRYVPDLGRAAEELGLVNAVGLDEAIRRTLSWRSGARHPVTELRHHEP